jgi:hypothetical protein
VEGEGVERTRNTICCNKSNDMPADFDSLRGTSDEIQFSNVGTDRTPASGSSDCSCLYARGLPNSSIVLADIGFYHFPGRQTVARREIQHSTVGRYGKINAPHS